MTAQCNRIDYTDTPVDTETYVELFSAVAFVVGQITVFDSSGQTMQLKVTSTSGDTTIMIPPGGGNFPLEMNRGDSLSIIAISDTADSGENVVNLFFN